MASQTLLKITATPLSVLAGEDKGGFQRAVRETCDKPQRTVLHKGASEKAQSPTQRKCVKDFIQLRMSQERTKVQ
jgi:hypothetical protein